MTGEKSTSPRSKLYVVVVVVVVGQQRRKKSGRRRVEEGGIDAANKAGLANDAPADAWAL